eukprot:scaffold38459_cov45-Phaeocystis_antarctica.AAC.1
MRDLLLSLSSPADRAAADDSDRTCRRRRQALQVSPALRARVGRARDRARRSPPGRAPGNAQRAQLVHGVSHRGSATGRDNHANVEVPAPLRPRSSGWEPLRRGLRDRPEQHRAQSWAIALRSPASERSPAPHGIHQIYIYCREASVSFGTGGPLLDTSWTFCVVGGH